MSHATDIRADGQSPLSNYANFLVAVLKNLERLLDRDAEAVRILTAEPALPEAIQRSQRWLSDRQLEKQFGGVVCSSRIWTRRDEKRVNLLRGLRDGIWPACRAARYLAWLEPQSGASRHDYWFRLAVNEARQDGTAAVLCPKLDEGKIIYDQMIDAARAVTQDDGGWPNFDQARFDLGILACELMNWTKQPAAPNGSEGDPELAMLTGKPKRAATVNERMAGMIMENSEAMGWNSTQWATHLKCAKSTVVATATWKKLEIIRQQAKAERMKDRRRKPKASDKQRD